MSTKLSLLSLLYLSGLTPLTPVFGYQAGDPPLPSPSARQIEQALRLGNQFQNMAPQQNRPRTGASIPISYIYSPEYYARHYSNRYFFYPQRTSKYILRFSPHRNPRFPGFSPFFGRSQPDSGFKFHQHND